ncbi:hypothetical protein ACXYRO_00435 [Mycoplasma sp. 4013]
MFKRQDIIEDLVVKYIYFYEVKDKNNYNYRFVSELLKEEMIYTKPDFKMNVNLILKWVKMYKESVKLLNLNNIRIIYKNHFDLYKKVQNYKLSNYKSFILYNQICLNNYKSPLYQLNFNKNFSNKKEFDSFYKYEYYDFNFLTK